MLDSNIICVRADSYQFGILGGGGERGVAVDLLNRFDFILTKHTLRSKELEF